MPALAILTFWLGIYYFDRSASPFIFKKNIYTFVLVVVVVSGVNKSVVGMWEITKKN